MVMARIPWCFRNYSSVHTSGYLLEIPSGEKQEKIVVYYLTDLSSNILSGDK